MPFFVGIIVLMLGYLYYFIWRLLGLWLKKHKLIRILAALAVLALSGALAFRNMGVAAVYILHVLGFSLVLNLIWLPVRTYLKKSDKAKIWKKIHQSGLVALAAAAIMVGYGYLNMNHVVVSRYQLETEKELPQSLVILQITDLHTGTSLNMDEVEAYCREYQQEEPDLLFLTGDIYDESTTREEMERVTAALGAIETTYGSYFVFGNHDYNSYTREPFYTAEELRQELTKAGIHVLEDQGYSITEGLSVLGRIDASVPRENLDTLIGQVNTDDYVILLDHQPREPQEAADAGIDLQLSGHTHAGQIWPGNLINVWTGNEPWNYGLFSIEDLNLVVSSGMAGWGMPLRTTNHSEVVVITLESTGKE